jgi:hypothetical protein
VWNVDARSRMQQNDVERKVLKKEGANHQIVYHLEKGR